MRLITIMTAGVICLPAVAQDISRADADSWLSGYEAAWEARDADAAGALFTDNARYFETPWSEPFRGRSGIREYWAGITADQRSVDFRFEVIATNEMTAVAHWSATFTLESSAVALALDGVFVLEFGPDGLVHELREWWVLKP